MNRPDDAAKELEQLLMALVDGGLTPEQQQHLAALLRDDPALQEQYRDYLMLDALLRWEPPAQQAVAPPVRRRRRWPYAVGAVAAVAAGLLLAVVLWPRPVVPPTHALPAEPTDNTVAVLLQAPGAEWESTSLPTRPGSPLPPGKLRLKSGLAYIEFYSGATVILEGPAEFELVSRNVASCTRGKLRAVVPPHAKGFTIRSPGLKLVDQGTEFGLDVGTEKTEVHVFQGQVDLDDGGGQAIPRELTTGQSLRLDGPGQMSRIDSNPAAFRTTQELADRLQGERRRRRDEWRQASAKVRQDEDVLVYYTFEGGDPWSRTLVDQARGRKEPRDGAIVGCRWDTGRWQGKQGLEFRQVSDRVRLHIPGEHDQVTLMAWVRVDALPNRNNSLLMTDGWEQHEAHWQIGDDGTLILGVRSPSGKPNAHYHAPGVFGPSRLGQWCHLAVVYNREAGHVTHFVDGRPVAQLGLRFDGPLRFGDAEIGNWHLGTRRDSVPIRYFTGCIDEFLMVARALPEEEIEWHYAQGKPPL